MQVDVVLPAAGTSERMKLEMPKQFIPVLGIPVLAYTIEAFHSHPSVRHIVVVVNSTQMDFAQSVMDQYSFSKVILCSGSNTRHRSIHNGIQTLRPYCSDSDVVIIHDVARPLVQPDIVQQVAEAAQAHGAAGMTRPLVSTVIRGDHQDRLAESLDRSLYRNSEMPQAFQYGIIATAYKKCSAEDLDHGTECLLLALTYSHCHALLLPGSDDLWKVTYKKDLNTLESVLKIQQTRVSIQHVHGRGTALPGLTAACTLRQIQCVAGSKPANTFIIFSTTHDLSKLDETLDHVTKCYDSLSKSKLRLGLMVILVVMETMTTPGLNPGYDNNCERVEALESVCDSNQGKLLTAASSEAGPNVLTSEKSSIGSDGVSQIKNSEDRDCDVRLKTDLTAVTAGPSDSDQVCLTRDPSLSHSSVTGQDQNASTRHSDSQSKDSLVRLDGKGDAPRSGVNKRESCSPFQPPTGRDSSSVEEMGAKLDAFVCSTSNQSKDNRASPQACVDIRESCKSAVDVIQDHLDSCQLTPAPLVFGMSCRKNTSTEVLCERLAEVVWQRPSILLGQTLCL